MKTCHFSICRMLPQFPNLLKSKINPSKKKIWKLLVSDISTI